MTTLMVEDMHTSEDLEEEEEDTTVPVMDLDITQDTEEMMIGVTRDMGVDMVVMTTGATRLGRVDLHTGSAVILNPRTSHVLLLVHQAPRAERLRKVGLLRGWSCPTFQMVPIIAPPKPIHKALLQIEVLKGCCGLNMYIDFSLSV